MSDCRVPMPIFKKTKEAGVTIEFEPAKLKFACPDCGHEFEEKPHGGWLDWDELYNGTEHAECPECGTWFDLFVEDYL